MFYDVQAGWAHIVLPDAGEDAHAHEAKARIMLEERGWQIQGLQDARTGTPEALAAMPPDIRHRLERSGYALDFTAYEAGGGPEEPGAPFE